MRRPRRFLFLAFFTVTLLAVLAAITLAIHRPGLSAWRALQLETPPDAHQPQLSATWLGVTTLLISDGEHAILTDPFVSRPDGLLPLITDQRVAPEPAAIEKWLYQDGVPPIRAMVVGHSHYDHLLDAGAVGNKTGALLIGSESTANVGRGAGFPENQVIVAAPGKPIEIATFRVTFIPSKHAGATGGRPLGDIESPLATPARISEFRQGGSFSILIEHELGSILHHGSAGFVPGALDDYQVDVVMLGIALLPDLGTYLEEVVDAVGAKRIIPTHWDDFTRPLSEPVKPLPMPLVNLQGFFDDMAAQRPDISVRTLPLGEARVIFPESD